MTEDRAAVMERLLRRTWECLPGVLAEDCLLETDVDGLAKIADEVRAALGAEPIALVTVGRIEVPEEARSKADRWTRELVELTAPTMGENEVARDFRERVAEHARECRDFVERLTAEAGR